ncbi:MAG: hypothetical protein AAGA46_16190 [Cyanobacteria bacterium P01_F01_bin.13]
MSSHYFTHLATQIVNPTVEVRPRLGSRFESPQGRGRLAVPPLETSLPDEGLSMQQENDRPSVEQPVVEALSPPAISSPLLSVAEPSAVPPSNRLESSAESMSSDSVAEVRSHPAPLLKPEVPIPTASPTTTEPTTVPSNLEAPAPIQPLSSKLHSSDREHEPSTPVDALAYQEPTLTAPMATETLFPGSDTAATSMDAQAAPVKTSISLTPLPVSPHPVSLSLDQQIDRGADQETGQGTDQITASSTPQPTTPQPSTAKPRPGILNTPVVWAGDIVLHTSSEQVPEVPLINRSILAAESVLNPQPGVDAISPQNTLPIGPLTKPDITAPNIASHNNPGNKPQQTVAFPPLSAPIPQVPMLQPAGIEQVNNSPSVYPTISPKNIHRRPTPASPMVVSPMDSEAVPTSVQPTVNVSIGRIEVRMTPPPKPQPHRSSRPATGANVTTGASVTSLSNYLRQGGQS